MADQTRPTYTRRASLSGMPDQPESEPEQVQQNLIPMVGDMDKEQKKMLYEKMGFMEKAFTLGVLSYSTNLILLMKFPQYFWLWHLTKAFIFLPWRFVRFRRWGWEWYMMDFCYFVTYMTAFGCLHAFIRMTTGYHTVLTHYNYGFLRAAFSFANGALILAVPMFGNKLAFHDVDNTTSMYIHLSPALFFWTLRWGGGYGTSLIEATWPDMFRICADMQEADISVQSLKAAFWYTGPCAGKLVEFTVYPAVTWFLMWGIPYYLIMFCCLKGYLDRNDKTYLYVDTIKDTKGIGRFISKLPDSLKPLGYMTQHFLWTMTGALMSILLWNSFIMHTAMLSLVFLQALHNGSTFMFRVVAARHVQGMVQDVNKNYSPVKTTEQQDTPQAAKSSHEDTPEVGKP